MGKTLIIKGANFAQHGIPIPSSGNVDVTLALMGTLYQGGIDESGEYTTNTTRVSGVIVPISDIGATRGDKLVFHTPGEYAFGIRNGSSADNLPNNNYWYATTKPTASTESAYKGAEFTINEDYLGLTMGYGPSSSSLRGVISTDTVDGFIKGGTLKITLVKSNNP